jgi:hypothetical protein
MRGSRGGLQRDFGGVIRVTLATPPLATWPIGHVADAFSGSLHESDAREIEIARGKVSRS